MSVEFITQVISALMLSVGGVFAIIGGIGLVRFPDVFTRLHAGSIADTLAPLLIIGGLILLVGFDLLTFKLLAILFFLLFTTPAASHATARAAIAAGLKPLGEDARAQGDSSSNT